MRRGEREKEHEFAEKVIDKCSYMVLAMVGEDGAPYCVPLSPVRWGNNVYFHCALEGCKVNALRANGKVCMTFVGDTQVPPGRFTTYYESAIAFGTACEVADGTEKVEALRRLCLKYCPGDMGQFDAAVKGSLPVTGIWKISLDEVSAKSNFPIRQKN